MLTWLVGIRALACAVTCQLASCWRTVKSLVATSAAAMHSCGVYQLPVLLWNILMYQLVVLLQERLEHMVSLHIRAVTVGDPLAAGLFMKALSQQYDVWAETRYARKVRVSFERGSGMGLVCC